MKYTVSGAELASALKLITELLDISPAPRKFNFVPQEYEGSILAFMDEANRRLPVEADHTTARWQVYQQHVDEYLTRDLVAINHDIRRRLNDIGITLEHCHQTFTKITHIVQDFLLKTFVTNEIREARATCADVLRQHQWQHSVDQAYLRATAPASYTAYLSFLVSELQALRAHCLSYDLGPETEPYRTAIAQVFDAMAGCLAATAVHLKSPPTPPTFPAHVFATADDYQTFVRLHGTFLLKPADFSYLFRRWTAEHRIVATDSAFRHWYASWEGATFEALDYFKTLDRVNNPTRRLRYDYCLPLRPSA